MSIQDRLAARSARRSRTLRTRAYERAIANVNEQPRALGSVLIVYTICVLYWVIIIALVLGCLSVWWWTDQTFTHVLMTAIGLLLVALVFPRGLGTADTTWRTSDSQLRTYVDAVCDAVDHRRPTNIEFGLMWPPHWVPRGAGRSSAVVIGSAQWAMANESARTASLIIALARDSANRSNFLVRATASSLEEWMKFCNFDVGNITQTWGFGVAWTTTLAGGAGINEVAYARVQAAIVRWFLEILGIFPASVRTALGHADLRLDLDAFIHGLRTAASTVGGTATVTATLAAGQFDSADAAMQRHVLIGGATPLTAAREEGEKVLLPVSELAVRLSDVRAHVPADAYAVHYALALANSSLAARTLTIAAPEIPSDVTAPINRELVARYRNPYSFSG